MGALGKTGTLAALCAILLIASVRGYAEQDIWSRVESVETSRRVRVVLHDDRAADGAAKFIGRFASATPESVTILLRDGTTRTFRKDEVRKVLVRVPTMERVPAWVTTGLAGGLTILLEYYLLTDFVWLGGDHYPNTRHSRRLRGFAIFVAPAWAISTLAFSHKPVYKAKKR